MKEGTGESTYVFTLAMFSGAALGPITVPALHGQTKPPVYYVSEVDVTDLEGYLKEYAPKATASFKAFGGQTRAAGQEITQIEGAPPKRRVVIVKWGQLGTASGLAQFGAVQGRPQVGDKYAKIRAFAVEGLPTN